MADFSVPLIFDGHVDVLSKLYDLGASNPAQIFGGGYKAHIDLPKAKIGGFGGGFFAIYIPSKEVPIDGIEDNFVGEIYELPLPPAIDQVDALPVALKQISILLQLERAGHLKICTRVAQIKSCLASGVIAAVLHMEGAEAIDKDFVALDVFYAAGLRSIGPVWSRPNIFGHGVPFRYPSDGDTGPGLTEAGKELVRQCNQRKIMLDLSHLNEKGFWQVAKISKAPLVATHSNTHALSNCSRNLTDKQLAAIANSGGMVGLNFAVGFLRADGQWNTDTGLDIMMAHLDHLISHLGEDHVGIGSDFDGAQVPDAIGDASGLPHLREAMQKHGINDHLMTKLCHTNWLRVLERTWEN